jgi:DNA-binding NtrC family response regulator
VATSYTVLVVEQADVVRWITKRTLSRQGCRVLEAANAPEALALLAMAETHVDLVLIGAVGSLDSGQWDWRPGLPASSRRQRGATLELRLA